MNYETLSPFQLAENYVEAELAKVSGESVIGKYGAMVGATQARIGLMLNTLRAHYPDAYAMLVDQYDWGENTG